MGVRRPPWELVLVFLLVLVWIANGLVTTAYGNNAELYPMSTFSMFAGGGADTSPTHYFATEDGGEVLSTLAYHPDRTIPVSWDDNILRRLWDNYEMGCSSYTIPPYSGCPGESIAHWRIPEHLSGTWGQTVPARLGLEEPPPYLDLIRVQVRILDGVETERTLLFRFVPDTGEVIEVGPTA